METTLTIECDIRDAQAILYSASKIIRNAEICRNQERLDELVKNGVIQDNHLVIPRPQKGDTKCLSE